MDLKILETQNWLNSTYGGHSQWVTVPTNGQTGWPTIYGLTRALQIELGIATLSTNFGSGTMSALTSQVGSIGPNTGNSKPNVVRIAQGGLWCKGYSGGWTWGTYDATVQASVLSMTGAMGLNPSGVIAPKVMRSLLTMDAYVTLSGGSAAIREAQQWLNGKYWGRRDFPILPCDGLFSRNTQQGLMFAIQYEIGMADGTANGNFGTGTKNGISAQGGVSLGSSDTSKSWVRLFQAALRFNGYESPFDGVFGAGTKSVTEAFQSFVELPVTGSGTFSTWASLLVSMGDDSRPGTASDMATQLTPALCNALYGAGYRTVGRYISVLSKRYVPGELETIFDAGLKTFPIMQENNTEAADFTYEKGLDHGFQAARRLRQLGFKSDTTVFFSVDYDATDDGISARVIPFFEGVKTAMSMTRVDYNIGVYGTRNVCSRVISSGHASEAFVASMSWGWSGNLGFPLPAAWSYDQIKNYTLPGTNMEIDKNIQSVRASPAGASDVTPVPIENGAWDPFYWMTTHLTVLAERTNHLANVRGQAHSVLRYIHDKEPAYRTFQFELYLPPPTGQGTPEYDLYAVLPVRAEELESAVTETAFVPSYPVPGGIPAGTSHMAVTARGYALYGRPATPSQVDFADLGGWALDLATLWGDFITERATPSPATWQQTFDWFSAHLGVRDANPGTSRSFNFDDLVGDIDGYLIGSRMSDQPERTLDSIVREVRRLSINSPTWRFQTFLTERFGGSTSSAHSAAEDALSSGHMAIDGAVLYSMGGISFVISNYVSRTAGPTADERDAVATVWSTLLANLAANGPSAAPS